jgi:four helix bundle protein
VRPFRDLAVWKLGHEIVLEVYAITRAFPREELYGLTSQMRRAAYSITMNIVEGSVKSDKQFAFALRTSLGSAAELEYQFLLAHDLAYVSDAVHRSMLAKIQKEQRMLVAFIRNMPPVDDAMRTREGRWLMAEGLIAWDIVPEAEE